MAPLAALIPAAASAAGVAGSVGTALQAAGAAATLAGTAASVAGSLRAGKAAEQEAEFAAKQQERQAAETLAAGTRQVAERRRTANKLMSDQLASAANSGGGVANPTILDIIGDTAGRGEFLAQSDIFNAESAATGMRDQAAVYRAKGRNARGASWLDAFSEGVSGFGKAAGQGYDLGKTQGWWK